MPRTQSPRGERQQAAPSRTGPPEGPLGLLAPEVFGQLVDRERRTARGSLSMLVLGSPARDPQRHLGRLGRVLTRLVGAGRVGWLDEERLCVLLDGEGPGAKRLLEGCERLNAALAEPPLRASVTVVPSGETTIPLDPPVSAPARPWAMPRCW
jgi:hypothetical protein